jgi:hypothetical protein
LLTSPSGHLPAVRELLEAALRCVRWSFSLTKA